MKTLTGIRPSLWARCPTAAVFQGRGETEEEPPAETSEYFFRGNVFEEIVVRQVIAKNGRDDVEREVVIPIPGIGEGHADFYLKSSQTLGEVKSTVSPYPNSDTFTYGVRQLRIYMAYHPEAVEGALMMIDPNRMKPADVYTVRLTDEDRRNIEIERQYIVDNLAGRDELSPHGVEFRPCTKPGQARSRMCPFADACFKDWEEPVLSEVTDPDAVDAAARLAAIALLEQPHKAALKELEPDKKEIQAELAALVPEGDSVVGPFRVRRTHVVRQPSFSVKAFEAAGLDIEPLTEFFRGGSEHDRLTVTKAEEWGDVEYGEEAPF